MSLKDKINERLVADTESILDSNFNQVEQLFQFHEDGTIEIKSSYRDAGPQAEILIYLIAQRYAKEGELAENDHLSSQFFYNRIGRNESTIRDYFQSLRNEGFIEKGGKSDHRLIVENLPSALDFIEEEKE